MIQRATLVDPLHRFRNSHYAGKPKRLETIAKAIAKQTNLMVEALLTDAAIPDWKRAGDAATLQQIADLSIFCSDCLLQFTIKDLDRASGPAWLDADVIADILDLVSLMYGDFATGGPASGMTFDQSLQSRDPNDPDDIRYLTRLLDQLMAVEQTSATSQREAKMQKLQGLLAEHRRAFAYTLHSAL